MVTWGWDCGHIWGGCTVLWSFGAWIARLVGVLVDRDESAKRISDKGDEDAWVCA